MNDDSAEWMANLKASGQLWPEPPEGKGGVEGERQERPQGQRVEAADPPEGLGVPRGAATVEGQQVLGTCSPELVVAYCQLQARLHHILNSRITAPEKDAVEQCIAAARELLGGAPSLPSKPELAEWLREIFSADTGGTTWGTAAEELLLLLTGEVR